MIYINKNTINDIVLTLNENFDGNNFLFKFTYQANLSNPSLYWWNDAIYSCERYNHFKIEDNDTNGIFGATSGVLNLKPGQYKYEVWGSEDIINESNYLIVASQSSIEEGRLVVNGIDTTIDKRYN
jgi:hypothetical protein